MKKKIDFLLISKYLKVSSLIFLLLSFLAPLAPAITTNSGNASMTYGSGYSFIFGSNIINKNVSYEAISLAGIVLICLILLFLALVSMIISLSFKDNSSNLGKWITFLVGILLLIVSIIIVCSRKSVSNVLADALTGEHNPAISNTIFKNSRLNFGIWGLAFFGFLSSFLNFASLLFDGTFDKVRERIGII